MIFICLTIYFILTNFCIFIFNKHFFQNILNLLQIYWGERIGLFSSLVIVQLLGLAPLKIVEEFSSKIYVSK